MTNEIPHTKAITLSPNRRQWLVTFLPHILLSVAGYVYAGMDEMPLAAMALVLSVLLSVYLAYQLAYLHSIRYHVNSQQLVTTFGVFHRERNYMELYRIVDFYEHQSLMQRVCGLKTITIFSTDKNTPELKLIGVRDCLDVVGYLRPLVFYNRQRMRIHEFANY
jgi:membrane protein YdbS with pleckstrin-like domain